MHWADAVPNLLIGLREGLEAGLVVTILLAAANKLEHPEAEVGLSRSIWLGVLGAVAVAGSFAAVLTYSTNALSSRAQEAVGGVLSVLAVGLVTAMIFWMRRAAVGLSEHLRGQVGRAAALGSGALALTAFLAVGREGLETTLFLWTAVKASGQTTAPLFGAALGLVAAVVLCAGLYRRAIRLNLGLFFARTAVALIVIAAGVLSYGLGDLQDAGLVSGLHWVAFDVTAHADPNSWWVSILSGITDLTTKLTVLQVVAWAAYLGVVLPLFLSSGPAPAVFAVPPGAPSRSAEWWARVAGRRTWATATAMVAVPAVLAATTIVVLPAGATGSTTAVTVTTRSCAGDWRSGHTGTQTFSVADKSTKAGEINLDNSAGSVVAEIETIGPATTATMTATLSAGSYSFRCLLSGQAATVSAPVQITGPAGQSSPPPVAPVTVAELGGPNRSYQAYAASDLAQLTVAVGVLRAELAAGDLLAARTDWLTAQMDWERVGASYDSFGAYGLAVDGLPDGLPGGVKDPSFTGLHRLEYGLWHGQEPATLVPVADALLSTISTLKGNLDADDVAGDPTNLPIRAHEIIEDAQRDHLSGLDDEGAGAAYPETYADVQVDQVVVSALAPLIQSRAPGLLATVGTEQTRLQAALLATRVAGQWPPSSSVPLAQRELIDSSIGTLLETLAEIPNLLEVPPTP